MLIQRILKWKTRILHSLTQLNELNPQQYRRILIVRTDRIGDVILTLPLVRVLKTSMPQSRIAMLVRRYTAGLVEDNPDLEKIIYYDEGEKPVPLMRLVAELRREHFDVVVHTYPRFRLAIMTWIAGIPVRVGTGYRWYSFLFNKKVYEHRKDAKRHELAYNLGLLAALGWSVDYKNITPSLEVKAGTMEKVKSLLAGFGVRESDRLVVLHPGSGGSARNWSAKNFGLLGRHLCDLPNVRIVVTGTRTEQTLVDEVHSIVGGSSFTLVDGVNLKEYAALAKAASLLVANSTGPIHIASAVGTPVIGLYPHVVPMTADRWGPVTDKKAVFSPANKPPDCDKCVKEQLPLCECMDSISVDEVFKAAKQFLVYDSAKIMLTQ